MNNAAEKPCGFALPDGARLGPNCGVTAVAIVCGITFDEAWTSLRFGRNRNWKGRTTVSDWLRVLVSRNVPFEVRLPRPTTLQHWATFYAKPGTTYMVRTTGHVQVVKDGWVIDQLGPRRVSQFWGRRKRISHIIEIME